MYPGIHTNEYTYNFLDIVNVMWTWDFPPDGATVGLVLWLQNVGTSIYYPGQCCLRFSIG